VTLRGGVVACAVLAAGAWPAAARAQGRPVGPTVRALAALSPADVAAVSSKKIGQGESSRQLRPAHCTSSGVHAKGSTMGLPEFSRTTGAAVNGVPAAGTGG
jgi:hypothetical protein